MQCLVSRRVVARLDHLSLWKELAAGLSRSLFFYLIAASAFVAQQDIINLCCFVFEEEN
jgi:hypothetical protein